MNAVLQYRTAIWSFKSEHDSVMPKELEPARLAHHQKTLETLWNTLNNSERLELDSLRPSVVLNPQTPSVRPNDQPR